MKITKAHKIKNCLQSSEMTLLIFDQRIDRGFVMFLSENGKVEIYENFPRPYYCISIQNRYIIKGAIGNFSARLYTFAADSEIILEELKMKTANYSISSI